MTVDPRAALDRLNAALEAHFQAVSLRRGDDDAKLDEAFEVLADAFEVYEAAIVREYGESLPFSMSEDGDDEFDEDDEDLDDEDLDEDDLDDELDEDSEDD